jgi:hypothetical protein
MTGLRRWRLDVTAPYTLHLAADARLSTVDPLDDQVWVLSLGAVDDPALALQTAYGGRVGMANIIPMWQVDGRSIHQMQAYAVAPSVVTFAPAYIQTQAMITPDLQLTAEHWCMESYAFGVRYHLKNTGAQDLTVRVDLFAHVSNDTRDLPLAIMALADGTDALSMGRLQRLEPVTLLEGGRVVLRDGQREAKVGHSLTVPAGETIPLRWVHAGLGKMADSLDRAEWWLAQDWDAQITALTEAAMAIPDVTTGDPDQDATIAFSGRVLVQGFLRATGDLPYPVFVTTRRPDRGFSQRGDATDYPRGWNGMTVHQAYLAALAVATIQPEWAKGIVRNFLSIQAEDGTIDLAPGLGGQREDLLCLPVLARLAWNIYQLTEDLTFIESVFPPLLKFFNQWSSEEVDVDYDTMPEYQAERQTGYVFWPTFGSRESWAQNAAIHLSETPDLAAYMLSECAALSAMAREIGNPGAYELTNRLGRLQTYLARLWRDELNRYAYQDRDNDRATPYVEILPETRADEEHIIALELDVPSRVIVRLRGGASRPPSGTITLVGVDLNGQEQTETLEISEERWGYSAGTVLSTRLYQRVDRITSSGLSRVFKLQAHTVDYTRLDINALLPLMLEGLPEDRLEPLLDLLTDEAHFWRPQGMTIVSAQDPAFDASSRRGGGGVWPYWITLIGEGLLANGKHGLASRLIKTLLATQTAVLKKQKTFSEFYHADQPIGRGEDHHIGGIVPLYLLLRVLGVQIVNDRRLYTGGPFHWGHPVTIRQHGVEVRRSDTGTRVTFPSGYTVNLGGDASWQLVEDMTTDAPTLTLPQTVRPPKPTATGETKRVIIDVKAEDD